MPTTTSPPSAYAREAMRLRIVTAAADLIAHEGRAALTTRSIGAAAGVQPPTIYRLFGDMDGLIDAVVTHGYRSYFAEKVARRPGRDPVVDLRRGWDLHVEFGLTNPALYVLMYADPSRGRTPTAVAASRAVLVEHVHRVAEAGRLRVPEQRAADLIHAAGSGTVLTLLAYPVGQRDSRLSALAREAAIAAVTHDYVPDASGPVGAAITLRARLRETTGMTEAERALLDEWLRRISE